MAPADQLGKAVAGLQIGGGAAGHVSIRLNPHELGGVEIQLRRTQDGGASLSLAVERPETLRVLQADLSHLHQALDRAGVPMEQRNVTLHLAADSGAPLQQGGGGTAGQGGSSGGSSSAGQQRQQGGRQVVAPAAAFARELQPVCASWRPSGFDITA